MAVQVWFGEDLRRWLAAAVAFALDTPSSSAKVEFVKGALAMARTLALAAGIPWMGILADARSALRGEGTAELPTFTRPNQEHQG